MHPWNLTVDEAEILQESLAEDCILEGDPEVDTVAGIDISIYPESELAITSIVLYSLQQEDVINEVLLLGDLTFPYVPGLLAFREAPLMLQAMMLIDREPDCLIVDGHGYAHPRRFGLASHLGLLLELPSIGCAKSILVGEYDEPHKNIGSYTDIWDGEPIGYAFRSLEEADPLFISAGHRISRENILPIIREVTDGTSKLPLPVHRADKLARKERERLENFAEPFRERDSGVFLVGGALRDLLSGNRPEDYDLLVTEFSDEISEGLSNKYGSHFFQIDEERNIYRMDAEELQLDVTVIEDDEVVDDLQRRDFTINSIALDMNREAWIDPVSGRDDIKQNKIRPTDVSNLHDDPLRLLRAYRLATRLDFELSQEIVDEISAVATELNNVSQERIVDELFKIMNLSDSVTCLQKIAEGELLEHVGFLRGSTVKEYKRIAHWIPILEGYELFTGEYHGGYSLLTGFKVVRLFVPDELKQWPIHERILTIGLSSHENLKSVPDFDVLFGSRWSLVGRLLGEGLRGEWSSDEIGNSLSRLRRYLRNREQLEKEIVENLRESSDTPGAIGERKKEILREELPGLWENRMTPILEAQSTN